MTDAPKADTAAAPSGQSTQRVSLARAWPLLALALGLVAFFAFGWDDYLTFETLRDNRQALKAWVDDAYGLAALAFIAAYIVAVTFSLPIGLVLSIAGGFLFGWIPGTVFIVIGATIGATLLFLVAKTSLGEPLRAKLRNKEFFRKLADGFDEDSFNYLLFLRLVPVFPFWAVNLAPSVLGVPLRTYVVATFLGIIPGAAVYASVGNGLGAVFDAGGTPDVGLILRPEILLPILALAVLSLVPVLLKRLRNRNSES